jgi:hypothetical protein
VNTGYNLFTTYPVSVNSSSMSQEVKRFKHVRKQENCSPYMPSEIRHTPGRFQTTPPWLPDGHRLPLPEMWEATGKSGSSYNTPDSKHCRLYMPKLTDGVEDLLPILLCVFLVNLWPAWSRPSPGRAGRPSNVKYLSDAKSKSTTRPLE